MVTRKCCVLLHVLLLLVRGGCENECCAGRGDQAIYDSNEGKAQCRGEDGERSRTDCQGDIRVFGSNSSKTDSFFVATSYCRDEFRVDDGEVREAYFFCDSSKSNQNQTKKTILVPKCCRLEEGFDPVQKKCVPRPFKWTLPKLHSRAAGIWNLSGYDYLVHVDDLASNPCSKKYSRPSKDPRQHYEVQETGYLLVSNMNATYPRGDYCLDHLLLSNGSWIQMALTCDPEEKRILQECKDRVCVQKCCPLGEYLDKSQTRLQCVPGGKIWDHEDLFGSHHENGRLTANEIHGIASYPKCQGISGRGHLLQPTQDPRDDFSLTPSGALQIEEAGIEIKVPQYCVDDAGNSSEVMQLVALVCLAEVSHEESETMYFVKSVLIVLLAVFLLLTFLLYLALPESTSVHGVTLLSYVGCLLVASIALIVGQIGAHNGISNALCLASALVTFFGYLAAFFWLNVMSFDVWRTVRYLKAATTKKEKRRKLIGYGLYAFGVPTCIFTAACVVDFAPGIPDHVIKLGLDPDQRCGFNEHHVGTILYFYGPVAFLLLVNVGFFALTSHQLIRNAKKTAQLTSSQKPSQNFWLYLKLFVVMGLSWITEVISFLVKGPEEYWIFTDAINCFQGLFIFVIVICKKDTLEILRRRVARFGRANRGESALGNGGSRPFGGEHPGATRLGAFGRSRESDSSGTRVSEVSAPDNVATSRF